MQSHHEVITIIQSHHESQGHHESQSHVHGNTTLEAERSLYPYTSKSGQIVVGCLKHIHVTEELDVQKIHSSSSELVSSSDEESSEESSDSSSKDAAPDF